MKLINRTRTVEASDGDVRCRELPSRDPCPARHAAHPARRTLQVALMLTAVAASGCRREEKNDYESVSEPQTVRLVRTDVRTIVRQVGQPSFIESFERTAVYPKMTAYIEKWIVDIGDKVKKGDVLATLFVPEIVEDHRTKQATVGLDREKVALAKQLVKVAAADVLAAQARLGEAKARLATEEAEVAHWESQSKRLERESKNEVVPPQVALESNDRLKQSIASRAAAKAGVDRASSDFMARKAALAEAEVDVKVAEAALAVAQSDERRLAAWVGYLTLNAPYDGIIVARNANTFDFVLPSTGDPNALPHAPDVSTEKAAPIYVVDRTDIVRVFIDIPEQDAEYVRIGTPALVRARAFRDQPVPGKVTRTSWALNFKSRTLRAEVDLPNPGGRLLPGMYAYGTVIIERPNVRAVPVEALTSAGDRTYFWLYRDGRAVRTEVRRGVADGRWIEVTDRRRPEEGSSAKWHPVDGTEQVILGDLSILADGDSVRIAPENKETPADGQARVVRQPTFDTRGPARP
ncbi:MAG: efflux RND transporter periplasmic adaptor subunit [Isosphaeraceae bacterium]